jgi:hypothetical protein
VGKDRRLMGAEEDREKREREDLFEAGGRGRGEMGTRECNGGVNLLKVHCTHGWNYYSEIPLYY